MKTLGSRIRTARKKAVLTQAALAAKLHCSPGAVAQWELNIARPSLDRLRKLAELLKINFAELIDGEPKQVSPELDNYAKLLRSSGLEPAAIAECVNTIARLSKQSQQRADSSVDRVLSQMPKFLSQPTTLMGVANADERDGKVYDSENLEKATVTARAIDPRCITVRGQSAENLARDGQQVIVDGAYTNVPVGEACVVLTRDGLLRLKRRYTDKGNKRRYQSINPKFPMFEVTARDVVAEFPVVSTLLRSNVLSPLETVNESPRR